MIFAQILEGLNQQIIGKWHSKRKENKLDILHVSTLCCYVRTLCVGQITQTFEATTKKNAFELDVYVHVIEKIFDITITTADQYFRAL